MPSGDLTRMREFRTTGTPSITRERIFTES